MSQACLLEVAEIQGSLRFTGSYVHNRAHKIVASSTAKSQLSASKAQSMILCLQQPTGGPIL